MQGVNKTLMLLRFAVERMYYANIEHVVNGILTLYFSDIIIYAKRNELIIAPAHKNKLDDVVPVEWYMGFADNFMRVKSDAFMVDCRVMDYHDLPVDQLGVLKLPPFVLQGIEMILDVYGKKHEDIVVQPVIEEKEQKMNSISVKPPVKEERHYETYKINPTWKDFKRNVDKLVTDKADEFIPFGRGMFVIKNPRVTDAEQSMYMIDIYFNLQLSDKYNMDPEFNIGRVIFGPNQMKLIINFTEDGKHSVSTMGYYQEINEFTSKHKFNSLIMELLYAFAVQRETVNT